MSNSFKPKDYLKFSEDLLKRGGISQNEALFRGSISRAYYSAFLTARDIIDKKYPLGIDRDKSDVHRQVCEILKVFHPFEPDLSDNLFDLKQLRVDADYHFRNAECLEEQIIDSSCDFNIKQNAIDCTIIAKDFIIKLNRIPLSRLP
jgi:hypothetical protein